MSRSENEAPKGKFPARATVAVLLVLGAVGWLTFRSLGPRAPKDLILASGSIEADETVIAPKVAGKLATLLVDEGSDVRKGQLLATLDDTELQAQSEQAKAALEGANARLEAAVNGNRPQQIAEADAQFKAAESAAQGSEEALRIAARNLGKVTDLKSQVDAASARLDQTQAAYVQAVQGLNLVLAGSRPHQIDQAKAALAQAQVQRSKAESDALRTKTLEEAGAASRLQLENAQAVRDAAVRAAEEARAHLADLQAGARPEEIRQAQLQVAQAQANRDGARTALANARVAYRDRLAAQSQFESAASGAKVARAQVEAAAAQSSLLKAGSRPEDVRNAKAARDQAAAALAYAKALVSDTRLYAPSAGVVKTKTALPGETLNPGTPILTLADLDHVWVRVYVPEDRYGRLRLGQSVAFTADSFPGETFGGRIVAISSDAEFTPKNAQTPEERVKLVFGVKIQLENTGRKLRPGMPGDAMIHLQ